jgi:hypothetical protein
MDIAHAITATGNKNIKHNKPRFHFRIRFDSDEIGRSIKYAWQRLMRGYSDADLWDLGNVICKFVQPRLRAFIKKAGHSYPAGLKSIDEWKYILKEMEWAIDTLVKDDDGVGSEDYIRYNAKQRLDHNKRMDAALKLCGEYIFTLWD